MSSSLKLNGIDELAKALAYALQDSLRELEKQNESILGNMMARVNKDSSKVSELTRRVEKIENMFKEFSK